MLEENTKENLIGEWVDKINDVTYDLMKSMKEELTAEEIERVIEAIDGFTKGYRYIIKPNPETSQLVKILNYKDFSDSKMIVK